MGLDMFFYNNGCEVGYLRKANHIHNWIRKNVCNGELLNLEDYKLTEKNLLDLYADCKKVLESSELESKYGPIKDPTVAKQVLPRTEGFFYGSQDYDYYYLEQIKETMQIIDNIFKTTDFSRDTVEYKAWW